MKPTRLLFSALILFSFAITTAAEAGTGRPGHKGTISAYAPSITDVFDSERCKKKKLTWDYIGCGKELRARVKARLCAKHGKGLHKYYYQVGDGKKSNSSAYCKDSDLANTPQGGYDAGSAHDDDDHGGNRAAGRKGRVAAYFPDLGTVFDSKACAKKRLGYDYTSCGKALRARVKQRLCKRLGKGLHKYYYQVGDNKKSKSSVYCKR